MNYLYAWTCLLFLILILNNNYSGPLFKAAHLSKEIFRLHLSHGNVSEEENDGFTQKFLIY